MENKAAPLHVAIPTSRAQVLVGTGGIGSGVFFALDGDHALGREESRSGRFLDKRDYCKLHIISHYVKALLGPEFAAILVGRVGQDEVGQRLLDEIAAAGLDTRLVPLSPDAQTLFSTCFIYPDGSGGNLTTADSASAQVTPADVDQVAPVFAESAGRGVALAAPEVPLAARLRLLELGTRHNFFRAASFTTAEVGSPLAARIIAHSDLLAINLDEAAGLAGLTAPDLPAADIVEAVIEKLQHLHPEMSLAVTAGRLGSWVWDEGFLQHLPVITTTVASTAGAGDAFLAGLIASWVAGLPFHQGHALAGLAAALSVTSPHTIHPGLNRLTLRDFAAEHHVTLPSSVQRLVADTP